MKKLTLVFLILFSITSFAQPQKTALILIDIQNFYYPGGAAELHNPKQAGLNAQKVLKHFRSSNQLVIHVRHNFEPGGEIHTDVSPEKGEKIISKDEVNAFKGTDLLEHLKEHQITHIVLAGMQTHMCLEAATRAAHDYDFSCTVIEDACATRDLKFENITVKAEDVHISTLATLKSYANILDAKQYLKQEESGKQY